MEDMVQPTLSPTRPVGDDAVSRRIRARILRRLAAEQPEHPRLKTPEAQELVRYGRALLIEAQGLDARRLGFVRWLADRGRIGG